MTSCCKALQHAKTKYDKKKGADTTRSFCFPEKDNWFSV